ncbi:hypothetical protein L1987_46686 [Smallanthus sonchifolius]|uniref:Uncharacterized protein n=1 Tax=Smallanthus sonchifolius TaxID=185202 RepID=A0ACB9G1E4_9ASTR|nr:hypothetical protein L1987_46686 [Smallanthus sonchifolius]
MEGIMAEFQSGLKCFQIDDDEGEKISKLLEQAAEPEVIMADMSLEQLTSFATYQAKIEVTISGEVTISDHRLRRNVYSPHTSEVTISGLMSEPTAKVKMEDPPNG